MSINIPIGSQIKTLRLKNNMTLKQLSEQTDLSTGFLSQLERGLSSVAIDSLDKIANALGVPLASFFNDDIVENQNSIVHSFEAQAIPVSEQIVQYILSNDKKHFNMLPRIYMLMPNSCANDNKLEMYSHTGEEFIYILEGVVTFFLAKQQNTLYPGDSIHIHSKEPHNWTNRTNLVAKLLCINTPNPFHNIETNDFNIDTLVNN